MENIKNKLKKRKASRRSLMILPSLHKKRLLSVYQNANAIIKQNNERQDDFISFVLLSMACKNLIRTSATIL
jgi:hypothetical protein